MLIGPLVDLLYGAILSRLKKAQAVVFNRLDASYVTKFVAIGSKPSVHSLSRSRFDAVMSVLDSEESSPLNKVNKENIHISVEDGAAPTQDQLIKGVIWINHMVSRQRKVLVHCNLGRARSALVVCAYLVYIGYDSRTALNFVKSARSCVYLNERQKMALQEFERNLL